MTIEQFLWKTVVKTGREARLLVESQLVKIIKPHPGDEGIAFPGEEVYPDYIVKVYRRDIGWQIISHPSSNGVRDSFEDINIKDSNGKSLIVGNRVECIDPGKELGLNADHFYIVTAILDDWTISVRSEFNDEKLSPRMAGRFRLPIE